MRPAITAPVCAHPGHECRDLAPNRLRTLAQNGAYYGMEKRLGRDQSRAIVRAVAGHECTRCLTRGEMHEVLNRQRLGLGESVERYNHEKRREMVHGPRRVPAEAPAPSAAQLGMIDEIAAGIPDFTPSHFEAMCKHYLHGKRAPETRREASNMIQALKRMRDGHWKVKHPVKDESGKRDGGPADILQFPTRQAESPAVPADDEVPF